MRRISTALIATAVAIVLPALAGAQQPDSTRRDTPDTLAAVDTVTDDRFLPREVAREVAALYEAPGTLRVSGSFDIVSGREVTGDLVVLDGPLTVAGHVTGSIAAVNADVRLRPGARIDGNLLVVGGTVTGEEDGVVRGTLRVHRQPLYYRVDGDRLVVERGVGETRWWSRVRGRSRNRLLSDITLASAHTYNRVEGLPILVGPTLEQQFGWGRASLDVLGVVRTAANFRWDSDNLGHDVRGEVHLGDRGGLLLGGRLYDVVESVEDWHLRDTEVGLASFFLHRDFRDYFDRHGARGYVGLFAGRAAELTAGLSDERWGTREQRDPFTLFRNGANWRPNPAMDEGRFHVANLTLRVDTRNDRDDPWAGWYVVADVEHGSGRYGFVAPTSAGVRDGVAAGDRARYTRGFLDLRRYNRLTPEAQLNLRLAMGGWLEGDELPLQRRFSLGGPGTLPGFDFRRVLGDDDYLQCSAGEGSEPPGRPAQCERFAMAQVEYRGDLSLRLGVFDGEDDEGDTGRRRRRGGHLISTDFTWVVFADAGRGWLVGPRSSARQYPKGDFPPLGSFRTDVGAGLDFGTIGVYVAKAMSDADRRANFFVRVKRRF